MIRPAGTIKFSRSEGGYWTGTVEPWGARATILSGIPAVGTAYSVTWGAGEPWAAATLRDVDFAESPDGKRGILTLHYSDDPSTANDTPSTETANPAGSTADNTAVYSIRESGLSLPISMHPDYLMNWDHDLVVRIDENGSWDGPGGYTWEAAKTPQISDPAYAWRVKWVRWDQGFDAVDATGSKFGIYRAATKPGTEEFAVSGPQVVESRWFSNKTAADAFIAANRRGTLKTPEQTYEITDGKWIIIDMTLTPDGRRWRGEVVYQWANTWRDIYGAE